MHGSGGTSVQSSCVQALPFNPNPHPSALRIKLIWDQSCNVGLRQSVRSDFWWKMRWNQSLQLGLIPRCCCASRVPQGLWPGAAPLLLEKWMFCALASQNSSGGALGVPRMKWPMKCSSTPWQGLSKRRVGNGWVVLCDSSDPGCPFPGSHSALGKACW